MKSEVFYDRLSSSEKLKNFEEPKKNRSRLVLASFLIGVGICFLMGVQMMDKKTVKKLNDEQLANKYYLMADGYMSSSRVNRAKTINYYRRASELGHTLAMESLGDLLIEKAKKMVKKFNNNKLSVNEKG